MKRSVGGKIGERVGGGVGKCPTVNCTYAGVDFTERGEVENFILLRAQETTNQTQRNTLT